MAPIQPTRSPLMMRAQTHVQRARPLPQTGAPLRHASTVTTPSRATGTAQAPAKPAAPAKAWHLPRLRWPFGKGTKQRMRDAREAFATRDFARANAKLDKVLAAEPQRFDARLLRALVSASTGDLEGAHKDFAALLLERPYDEDTHMARALLAYHQRNYSTAWVSLTHVTVHYPGHSVAWVFRSLVNSALGHHKMAEADLQHLRLTLHEDHEDIVVAAAKDLSLGLTADAYHRMDPLMQQPNQPHLVTILWAHVTDLLGYRGAALELYDEALKCDPMDTTSAALRAGLLQPLP